MNLSVTSRCSASATSATRGEAPLNFAARSPGELAAGADGPPHRFGDLLERDLKDVVQDEGDPLAGCEPAQHLQQRTADLVIEGDPIGRIRIGGRHDIDRVALGGSFAPDARRADLVQAEPTGDHREPAPDVVDLSHIGSGQSQEGLLGDVLGFADVAQHLIGEVDQVGAVATPRRLHRR